MAWVEFTPAIFAQRISGPELSALKNAARSSGQDGDSLVQECVNRVIAEVRGRVGACKNNSLGLEGTIPSELIDAACAIAVYRFIIRLPGQTSLLDEKRTMAYTDAASLLRDVAACRLAIVPPETPAPSNEQPGSQGAAVVRCRPNIQTRKDLDGLL